MPGLDDSLALTLFVFLLVRGWQAPGGAASRYLISKGQEEQVGQKEVRAGGGRGRSETSRVGLEESKRTIRVGVTLKE